MKIIKKIVFVLSIMCLGLPIYSQDNVSIPERTPEQEASRQTEKLQQELNLSQEQSRKVYEINVRYERQRQISNSRTEAMERIKNKNADMQKVLTGEQSNRLQNKRYERTTIDLPSSVRSPQNLNSSAYSPTTQYRTRTSTPATSPDRIVRSNFRGTSTQNQVRTEYPQSVQRSTSTIRETPVIQNNPYSTRSAVSPSYNEATRTQSTSAPRSSSTYSAPTRTEINTTPRSTSTPSSTAPKRTSTPSTTNRR